MDPSTNTCILMKGLNSKMAANMAAKTDKDLYFRSLVSYKGKWGANFDIFNAKVFIARSDNSVRMPQFKMAAILAAKHWNIYISARWSATKTNEASFLIYAKTRIWLPVGTRVKTLQSKMAANLVDKNTERSISQLIGQLQRQVRSRFWYNQCQGFEHS